MSQQFSTQQKTVTVNTIALGVLLGSIYVAILSLVVGVVLALVAGAAFFGI